MVHILEESGVLTWNSLKEPPQRNFLDWDLLKNAEYMLRHDSSEPMGIS